MSHIGYDFLIRTISISLIKPLMWEHCKEIIQCISKRELWNIYCDYKLSILHHGLGAILFHTMLTYKEPFGKQLQYELQKELLIIINKGLKEL